MIKRKYKVYRLTVNKKKLIGCTGSNLRQRLCQHRANSIRIAQGITVQNLLQFNKDIVKVKPSEIKMKVIKQFTNRNEAFKYEKQATKRLKANDRFDYYNTNLGGLAKAECNPMSKLSRDQVISIFRDTRKTKVIAKAYKVKLPVVLRIRRKATYITITNRLKNNYVWK